MDLISMETQEENNMIFRLIQQSKYNLSHDQTLMKRADVCIRAPL